MKPRLIVASVAFTVAVVLLGTAAYLFQGQLSNESAARESHDWPSVTGLVTASEVLDAPAQSGGLLQNIRDFRPRVSYRYTVQGREYESVRITFSDQKSSSYQRTKDFVDLYPLNGDAEVFYDPSDPAQSVLIQGGEPKSASGWYFGLGIVGAFFGVIAVGFFFEARKHRDSSLR